MKLLPFAASLLLASLAAHGAEPEAAPAPVVEKKAPWVFSLLPKAFQQNPELELTVVTEMTEAGKRLPPPSPAQPAYFEFYTPGAKDRGEEAGKGKTLPQADVEKVLSRSLATNGYLPAQRPDHAPSLLIVYTWGSHALLTESDDENPMLSPEIVARNLLDRAALVGGDKFARKMLQLFREADALATAASATIAPSGQPVFTPEMVRFANPINLYKMNSPKNDFLVNQMSSNVFYVSASAYDYKSVADNNRTLLWRTRMTVASDGVSQLQSLPVMVLSAAPFFGIETPEPEVITRRTVRQGSVEIGDAKVIEAVPTPTPAPVTPPPVQKK